MTSDPRTDRLEAEVSQLGQRMAGVEGELRQIGERLNGIEHRLTSLEGRVTMMWISTMGMIAAGVIALIVERLVSN